MSSKTIVKLGLFCAMIVALKWIWENDAALNAIILFGTAGVVPGTGIILSPQQVYIVLGLVLVLSVIIIFGKNMRRSIRNARANWIARHEALAEEPVSETGKMIIGPDKPAAHAARPVVITIPAQPGTLVKAWRTVRPKLLIALGTALELCVERGARLAVIVRRVSLQVYRHSVRFWLWAEPHIRRMDKQIETTLKRNKDVAAFLHMLSTAAKSAHAGIVAVRQRLEARSNRMPEE